jgi:hypothetical protein|tara:strand:- start:1179 stop:1823 length:645 start_codon:yes stop_codon:yes gene_type:complete
MANSNGSFGLRPLNKMGGATNSTGTSNYSLYEIKNDNSSKFYHGEAVIPLSTGYIGVPGAAAGGTVGLLGVFQGCEYVSSTTGRTVWSNYWPGSGADSNHPIKAYVNDDPMQLYAIATDATWTSKATARAGVFANANFSTGITGTDATGVSLGRLAVSTIATTAALQMRVMGWVDDPENADFTAAGVGAIVRLNNHFNSNNGAIAAGTPSTTGV